MRLLLDSCVWKPAATELRRLGFDVIAAADWPADPGDDAILSTAFSENRTLITLDKDFGALAILGGRPHTGIVRLFQIPARQQAAYTARAFLRYQNELTQGAIVTVDQSRMRLRLPL